MPKKTKPPPIKRYKRKPKQFIIDMPELEAKLQEAYDRGYDDAVYHRRVEKVWHRCSPSRMVH